jgi:anti-anti-sigma factor
MPDAEQCDGTLNVAIHSGVGLVRVAGRGTFKVGSALKHFGMAAIEADCSCILFDMTDCVGMDSTFMGVLAGLAAELRRRSSGDIILVNLSEKTRGLMATLGLDQIVRAYLAGSEPEDVGSLCPGEDVLKLLKVSPESRDDRARTMLEAHENLVDVSAENYPRFKDVLAFLREDVEKAAATKAGEA